MGIAKMQKIQIFTHESKVRQVLKSLQELEILEVTNVDEDFFAPICKDKVCAQDLEDILGFLQELFPQPKGFIENFIHTKTLLNKQQLQEILSKPQDITKKLSVFQKEKESYEAYQQQIYQLRAEAEKLKLYRHFDLPFKKLQKIKKVRFIYGLFSKNQYLKWQADRSYLTIEMHEEVLSQDEKSIYLAFLIFPEKEQELKDKLSSAGFEEVYLPPATKSYAAQLIKAEKDIQAFEGKKSKSLVKLKELFQKEKKHLTAWADNLKNEEGIQLWGKNLLKTKKVAMVEGWIMSLRFQDLQDGLKVFSEDIQLIEAPHSEDDVPPVVLENKQLAPFEAVTTVYGLPQTTEFDPTPFLSVFFALFFGICLSDFGYGVVLMLLAHTLFSKYKQQLTAYGKNLLTLIKYCGFSTMLVGILTGSYFGIDLQTLTWAPLRLLLLNLKITDPMADPLPLLIFSFILGITQIYFGLWLKYWIDLRQKGFKEASLSSGVWVYFISGLIGWVAFAKVAVLAILFKVIFISGLIGLVATQGRHQKNPLMRLGSGILSLYRLSNFMGDILSYSRLFALGLVTSVLSVVINLLASMTGGIPLVGGLIMILLLIGGHIFNFLINILGAFVHSARLQYVEYFSKFFEGGGRFFRPFSWRTKYIKVSNQISK
ncbi:V-type ATP synthase subunit I [Candidatus Margulisiibacteriota bacterium]